eukprot:CAMPEP_0184339588 /NCGR_PEP_ID=MMETSP1089-20130417/8263_1 /TAXON_ID=38269 ORGANISM="Gloeochaete wittrockiana, Strain SAG46.84" /NCGR_SAMPLE_ID=MMETSP1089 /ASSEMBLY_ACC=CAM_ASM_000445 /LENGTH=383 /DNA_ID=CAMNT_0026666921 /DNA_START=88 /DNA_END=1239 /DNA_ORIENTATION=-
MESKRDEIAENVLQLVESAISRGFDDDLDSTDLVFAVINELVDFAHQTFPAEFSKRLVPLIHKACSYCVVDVSDRQETAFTSSDNSLEESSPAKTVAASPPLQESHLQIPKPSLKIDVSEPSAAGNIRVKEGHTLPEVRSETLVPKVVKREPSPTRDDEVNGNHSLHNDSHKHRNTSASPTLTQKADLKESHNQPEARPEGHKRLIKSDASTLLHRPSSAESIKQRLQDALLSKDTKEIMASLEDLDKIEITVAVLTSTNLGRVVLDVKPFGGELYCKSKYLVKKWKASLNYSSPQPQELRKSEGVVSPKPRDEMEGDKGSQYEMKDKHHPSFDKSPRKKSLDELRPLLREMYKQENAEKKKKSLVQLDEVPPMNNKKRKSTR